MHDSVRRREGTRLTVLAGEAAFHDCAAVYVQNSAVSAALSAKRLETAAAVRRVLCEKEEEHSAVTELKKELLRVKAAALRPTEGNMCIFEPDMDAVTLRELVNAGVAVTGGVCAAFSGGSPFFPGGRRELTPQPEDRSAFPLSPRAAAGLSLPGGPPAGRLFPGQPPQIPGNPALSNRRPERQGPVPTGGRALFFSLFLPGTAGRFFPGQTSAGNPRAGGRRQGLLPVRAGRRARFSPAAPQRASAPRWDRHTLPPPPRRCAGAQNTSWTSSI